MASHKTEEKKSDVKKQESAKEVKSEVVEPKVESKEDIYSKKMGHLSKPEKKEIIIKEIKPELQELIGKTGMKWSTIIDLWDGYCGDQDAMIADIAGRS
jgi:hypothetical protein